MDTNRKNNDCYFYYYSTCMKGDSCLFRHEENALGCEEVCSHWQQGKCFNQRCNLRHMELKKNRKAIPCYWESKPTGCCKPHCPFRHDLPRTLKSKEGSSETSVDSANHTQPKRGSQGSESSFGNPPVDPLVVNFEEESDNESVPSSTTTSIKESEEGTEFKYNEARKINLEIEDKNYSIKPIKLRRFSKRSAENTINFPESKFKQIKISNPIVNDNC